MDPWLLLPRILLFLDTLRPRDTVGSEGVAVVCSGFLRTILGIVAKNATVSLGTLAFFFPLVTYTFSSFNANDSLSTLLPRLQIHLFHAWRRSFVNGVSDVYIFSPWFSTFDCKEPMSSDESPCRTIPIRY